MTVRVWMTAIACHIEASSFPNWNGADQKRGFAIAEIS